MSESQEDTQHQESSPQRDQQPHKQRSKKRDSKRVNELQQQVDELTQDLQRERSDFANYQRRVESEKEQIMSHAKSDVVTQLLPVFDDLERALGHIPEELQDNAWAQGVGKVYERAQEKMNEVGIFKINAAHQPFDPELHEAVEFEDGDGNQEVVTEEMRTGYMLGDTVLRPAMVKVGKGSGQSRGSTQGTEQTADMEEQDGETESEGGEDAA